MRIFFIIWAVFSVQAAVWAQNKRAVIDKVIATVGGEIILLSEVQEQVAYAKSQDPNVSPEYACAALQNQIIQKLLVNQAKLDSLYPKEEEVEDQLTARVERLLTYFNQDQAALEEYYSQSIGEMKQSMRGDMKNQLMAEKMQGKITEKASITPAEVQAFFARIPKDSLPYFNSEVEIREIIFKPQVNPTEKAKARARIEDLRKQLQEGADFAALAKKHSDDPGSAREGGNLGWQKRGTFVQEFEATAYNLEKGQVSNVIETEFGFHIIQLMERRGNLINARHILIKPEITAADLERTRLRLDSIRTLVVKDTLSFSQAVKQFSDKKSQSYSNDGRVTNPRSGNTFFEVADLDTDIYFAIEGLEVNGISVPTPFRAPDGSKYFRLIQLQSRTKPHKADLKQDYNKIQKAALDQKKSGYTERWVLDRLRTTYLSIDPLFDGCPNLQELMQAATGQ